MKLFHFCPEKEKILMFEGREDFWILRYVERMRDADRSSYITVYFVHIEQMNNFLHAPCIFAYKVKQLKKSRLVLKF